MSIASAIIAARNKIADTYLAIENKGGTLPVVQNLDNLATALDSVSTNYFTVTVIDYDGTVLKKQTLASGATFTLPSQPSHEGLVFQEWSSSSINVINNTITVGDSDIIVGATYTTASGLTEFDITLTKTSGLSVTLNIDGTKNWGDGTSNTETTHTYNTEGNYTIACNGSTISTSSTYGLFGQNSSNKNCYVRKIRFGNNITNITASYLFANCNSLESVTISNSVTSISDYMFQYCYNITTVIIPSSVKSINQYAFNYCCSLENIVISNSITSIGNYAFNYCYSLKNIIVSNSVTSIGSQAFGYCYSLENIVIPDSVTSISSFAFFCCFLLDNVIIPGSVISEANCWFRSCTSLKNVVISNNITGFYDTFTGCRSLTNANIPNSIDTISNTFQDCISLTSVTIPNNIKHIESQAFYGCNGLTSIIIPNSVKTIGSHVFTGCQLKTIVIPDSVTDISGGFAGCTSLENITLSNNLINIGDQAFNGCTGLTDITIPDSVTTIGYNAFYGCTGLTSITIPSSVTTIGDQAFSGCTGLTSVTIAGNSGDNGFNIFYGCTNLATVIFLNSVTYIGYGMFQSCTGLTSVTIPSSVTSIYNEAFAMCEALTNIAIPGSVTSIGSYTFADCTNMQLYDFSNHTTIPTIGQQCFLNIGQDCKIMVPWALYNDWKEATNWALYADYIDTGTAATINFTVNPNGSTIYVRGQQIQGTSISYKGSTLPYVVCNSINNTILANTQTNITEGSIVNITADLTTSNKITLSTSTTGLTVKFAVNNTTLDATDEGNGNYSINVVGSGTSLSYVIKGEGYATVRGTVTTTGLDITIPITMEPATEEPWTRPNLTSNGQIGGDSFAVTCTPSYFEEQAWMAVDDVTQDGYQTEWYAPMEEHPEYIFYNPDPIKVSELKFVFGYRMAEEIEVYASEDGTTWESLDINYNPSPEYDETIGLSYTTCTLTNDNFYSYYKIVFMGWDVVTITDLEITAMQSV